MDVLKVFNLVVCTNTNSNVNTLVGSSGAFFSLLFAPLYILIPTTRFSVLAYVSIFIFTILIYSSQNTFIKLMITDKITKIPTIINSIFIAILLYILQCTIILLFLRYSICDKTLEWEQNDMHLTMQQYDTNEHKIGENGY